MKTSKFSKLLAISSIAIVAIFSFSPSARAQCANPVGAGGDILYNVDNSILQYCNNTDWVGMGGSGGGVSALDDLSDVDTAGKSANDILTWDGTNWVDQAPSGGGSCSVDTQTFNASGTWTKPACGKLVMIQCWGGGGGGGGGGAGGNTRSGTGGGGAAAEVVTVLYTTLGASEPVVIGNGGAGGAGGSPPSNGSTGGSSSFSLVTANGGGRGNRGWGNPNGSIPNPGAGGSGHFPGDSGSPLSPTLGPGSDGGDSANSPGTANGGVPGGGGKCVFRGHPASDSDNIRPPIPI